MSQGYCQRHHRHWQAEEAALTVQESLPYGQNNPKAANIILNRTGEPFRQQESYDRPVRHRAAREKVVRYIENNPLAAGLTQTPDAWRFSSAWTGQEAYPTN